MTASLITANTALWRLTTEQHRVAIGEGNIVGQNLGPSAGFGVFSLNPGYRVGPHFTLSAGIDNLFDKTYAEHLNAAPEGLVGYINTVRVNEPGAYRMGQGADRTRSVRYP